MTDYALYAFGGTGNRLLGRAPDEGWSSAAWRVRAGRGSEDAWQSWTWSLGNVAARADLLEACKSSVIRKQPIEEDLRARMAMPVDSKYASSDGARPSCMGIRRCIAI